MEISKYTLGFYFTPQLDKVALILKKRPDWQAGKYNGIGGKVEKGETPEMCMSREFLEEAGVYLTSWRHIADLEGSDFVVHVFTNLSISEGSQKIQTIEDEEVGWFEVSDLPRNMISNLYWLIPYCIDFWESSVYDGINFLTASYGE